MNKWKVLMTFLIGDEKMTLTVLLAVVDDIILRRDRKVVFQNVMTESEVDTLCQQRPDIKIGTKSEEDIFFLKTHLRINGVQHVPVYKVDKNCQVSAASRLDEDFRPLKYDINNDIYYDDVRYDANNKPNWEIDAAMLGTVNPGCYYLKCAKKNVAENVELTAKEDALFRVMVLPSSISFEDYKKMIEDILDIRTEIAIADNGLQSHHTELNLEKIRLDLLKISYYLHGAERSPRIKMQEIFKKVNKEKLNKYNNKVVRELCRSFAQITIKQPVKSESNNIYENRIIFYIISKIEEKLLHKIKKEFNNTSRTEKNLYEKITLFLQSEFDTKVDFKDPKNVIEVLKEKIKDLNKSEDNIFDRIRDYCEGQKSNNDGNLLGVKLIKRRTDDTACFNFELSQKSLCLNCKGWSNSSKSYDLYEFDDHWKPERQVSWGNTIFCNFELRMNDDREYGFLYGLLSNLKKDNGFIDQTGHMITSFYIGFQGNIETYQRQGDYDKVVCIIYKIIYIKVNNITYIFSRFINKNNASYEKNINKIKHNLKQLCREIFFNEFDRIYMSKNSCQSYINKLHNSTLHKVDTVKTNKELNNLNKTILKIKRNKIFKHLPLKNEGWKNTQIFANDRYYSKIAKILKNIDKHLGITDEPTSELVILRKADRLYEFWIFCKMVDVLQKQLGWTLKSGAYYSFKKNKMNKEEVFSKSNNLKFKEIINKFFKSNNVYSEGTQVLLQKKVESLDYKFNISIYYNHYFTSFNNDSPNFKKAFCKSIKPDFLYEIYLTNDSDEIVYDKIKIYLDAKYRNYQEQGRVEFFKDIVDVALVKYTQNFYISHENQMLYKNQNKDTIDNIKSNFPNASFIIHSDNSESKKFINYGGSYDTKFVDFCYKRYIKYNEYISEVNRTGTIGARLKGLPEGYPDYHYFDLPFWKENVEDYIKKGLTGLMPSEHIIGGFPLYPGNISHFKTFILLVFEYLFKRNYDNSEEISFDDNVDAYNKSHINTWEYCWSCPCTHKVRGQTLKTKGGYYKYYYLCRCGEFWVKTHCSFAGHSLVKHASENYHHNLLGKEDNNWFVACPECGDEGEQNNG